MASNLPQGPCAVCNTVTSKICGGCRDAPSYGSHSGAHTYYCSSSCQKSHWNTHRSECQNLQARKKLLRAAQILRGMSFAISQHASRCRLDRLIVETAEEGDAVKVTVEEPKVFPLEALWTLVPFPDTPKNLNTNILEGLIMHDTCTEAHAYMEPWAKELLAGIYSKIAMVNLITHGGTKLEILTKDKNGKIIPPCGSHFVYRVELRGSGEIWAVDLTGKQFGYSEVIYSWDELDRCGWTIDGVNYHVGGEAWVGLHMQVDEKRGISDELEKIIPSLARKYGGEKGNLRGVLKGPDTMFEEVKKRILNEVEDLVKGYMVKYSSLEETKKRNAKMMAWIPDPDDPKHLNCGWIGLPLGMGYGD